MRLIGQPAPYGRLSASLPLGIHSALGSSPPPSPSAMSKGIERGQTPPTPVKRNSPRNPAVAVTRIEQQREQSIEIAHPGVVRPFPPPIPLPRSELI